MEFLFSVTRFLHIIAGFIALFTFWIPIVTKKGGKIHRRVGWIYVVAMTLISLSAFYLGIYRIFFDKASSLEVIAFSWFLIFVAILSGGTAWYGMRVLRFKNRREPHRVFIDLFIPILLIVSGVGISIYGFLIKFSLITYFPLLGIFLGVSHLLYWLRKPQLKLEWWIEHLIGMLSCSIATITAFTVFSGPRLFKVDSAHPILWFIPTILIVPLIVGFSIHYARKFNKV